MSRLKDGFATLARPATWLAAILFAGAVVGCEVWGLTRMDRGLDERVDMVLMLLAAGSGLAALAASVLRPLIAFRAALARLVALVVLLPVLMVAGNGFTLWLWHMAHRFDFGEPDSIGHWIVSIVASAATNTFLFVSISLHVLLPQVLLPMLLLAVWLSRRSG